MAGCFGTFVIEWKCLKPEIYNEEHGYMKVIGRSQSEVVEKFKENNPDYEVINVTFKEGDSNDIRRI